MQTVHPNLVDVQLLEAQGQKQKVIVYPWVAAAVVEPVVWSQVQQEQQQLPWKLMLALAVVFVLVRQQTLCPHQLFVASSLFASVNDVMTQGREREREREREKEKEL